MGANADASSGGTGTNVRRGMLEHLAQTVADELRASMGNRPTALMTRHTAAIFAGFRIVLSSQPKVLQQVFQPEPLRGHASLAARLLWRQRQEPFSCIIGQGVD